MCNGDLPSDDGVMPFYFDGGGRKLMGWLHSPAGDRCMDLGLVVCIPFGYEAVCSYRSLRTLAERHASSGIATLRFDYSGNSELDEGPPPL